ncbi:P-loop containing nucleoside triphosphate hydrolase protein [Phanerochaete sordida]|uniref:P-loop containing nucleoside triphosphate hydrolase protein n=1 Tax=Phanerochaete sordida TaxID=48140 RepID=A0A9P3FZ97_9APHY|nr:P-loop containing nucleoside triphosphate hydrolase protein [Phanerochaete sordida]
MSTIPSPSILTQTETTSAVLVEHGISDAHSKPKDASKPEARVRIARYDQVYNPVTRRTELRKTSKPFVSKKLSKKKPILLVKRIINPNGTPGRTEIDILSEPLRKVLLDIHEDVQGLDLTSRTPSVDTQFFFHSRKALQVRLDEENAKEAPDAEVLEGIETALQFISEDLGSTIADFEVLISQSEITYDLLWALFPPNTYIRSFHRGTEQEFVVYGREFSYQCSMAGNFVDIRCDIVSNDGKSYGVSEEHITINEFPGTRSIFDLAGYPLDYHPEKEKLEEHAIRRGKVYAEITRHFYEISGPAVVDKTSTFSSSPLKVSGTERVMVDPAVFRLFRKNSGLVRHVSHTLKKDEIVDEHYLITTPVLLGFCFATKTWGGYALDRVQEITWAEDCFRQLVLGDKHKQLIRALIRQHSAKTVVFDDIVAGKGQGLVGLLCGNPGCGKTLTAEAVAEITHRPLYIVSAGELGIEPSHVDDKLNEILELAHLWDAVLLLDEADVFLQARDKMDVSRNALVSIFLRQVEYYRGILIFTTNLIESIDPAFESRIHFCVRYPDLDVGARKAIWKTFFSRSQVNPKDVTDEDIDRLSQFPLNGRQIKNAVSTAKSIAMDQESRLLVEHVNTVLEVMNDWHVAKAARQGLSESK